MGLCPAPALAVIRQSRALSIHPAPAPAAQIFVPLLPGPGYQGATLKLPSPFHSWRLSPARAIVIQQELAGQVRIESLPRPPRRVVGLDAAFSRDGRYCLAAAVLWDLETRKTAASRTAVRRLWFPYVPGLLSFREGPALLAAIRKLPARPDLLLCDGHGLAHPRRFGVACHLGVLCDLPAVGCAKSRLIGTHPDPGPLRGDHAMLREGSECLGLVLRTRDQTRPLYVSVGHRMTLEEARRVVLACGGGLRLPEPTRLADQRVTAMRRCLRPAAPPSR